MAIINPGLRMVSRGPDSVQIGVGPGGVVIEGLQQRDLALLQALRSGVADAAIPAQAAALGLAPERSREICHSLGPLLLSDDELRAQGFRAERLLPERTALLSLHHGPSRGLMSRREHAVVHVMGLGRTGAAVALVLVSAGVGTVLLEDDRAVTAVDVGPGSFRLADIGLVRSAALRRQLLELDPASRAHVLHEGGSAPDTGSVDLAIVVAHDTLAVTTAARFMGTERPHLLVLLREQDGTVGPLVVPGRTACCACVEWHRSDRDAQWLEVCEQLAGNTNQARRTGFLEDAALSTALAGTAAAQALLFLDAVNQPSSWSSVLSFHPDNGRWSHEEFATHPRCGCQLQDQALATISNTASP